MDARLRQEGGRLAGLPIGFRFRPTDEELLLHYLRRKALACPLPADIIPVADLARLHPWDLVPGDAEEEERFFFHLPATRCWRRGGGTSRAAGTGVWRQAGKEKLVVSPRCKQPVGAKRTLVFCHRGGGNKRATDWVMHEYRLLPAALPFPNYNPSSSAPHVSCPAHAKALERAMEWVVCRIFKRPKRGHADRAREEEAEEEEVVVPSSPTSCVTDDDSSNGADLEEGEGEQSSGNSVARLL